MRSKTEVGKARLGVTTSLAAFTIAAAILAGPLGCADNPATTRLLPPGGKGGIVGTLTFQGMANPPFPVAEVLAVQTDNPDCASDFGAIALLGTFNNFDTGQAADFLLDEVLPCLWVTEVQFPAGVIDFKFVTGTSAQTIAFDSPPDYGKLGPNTGLDPLEGAADAGAGGPDGNLSVTIPKAGIWTVVLNEATTPATYRITQDPLVIESDPADGTFEVIDIPAGSYDVSIEADGFLPVVRRGVAVQATRVTDLGTVSMEVASGALTGAVAFSDDPDPLPEATVSVLTAGTAAVVQSQSTTGAFSFVGLETGTYDIRVTAPAYFESLLEDVSYVNGSNTDIGTITMDPGCESQFTTIQIAGDFNQFNLSQAPFMTQGPGCVWSDTLTLASGLFNMKFVTDGAFDSPRDYGGNESQTLNAPGTFPTQLVSGTGTAIKFAIAAPGDYRFILDESRLQFSILPLGGGGGEGAILGEVGFEALTDAPFPVATVELRAAGSLTGLATRQTTAESRSFRFDLVEDGTYELSISATCFATTVKAGLAVSGAELDAGTVTLPAAPSGFSTIQIAASNTNNFASFDLGTAPFMTQGPGCVWTDTLSFPGVAAPYLRFVTDGAFSAPPDFGGSATVTAPDTVAVQANITGTGGGLRVRFLQAGDYIVVLDERRQRLEVRRAP